jgi:hypothetical protein
VLGAAVIVTVVVLAACSNGKADTSATTTTRAPSTTTSEASAAEQAVLRDYRAYWDAYLAASNPMNPENPALAEHATGPALEALQKGFLALKSAGRIIRGNFDLAPRVVSVDGETAVVRDCYGDATGIYDAASGARQDTPSGKRHLATATLRLDGGTWKMQRLADEGLGCTAA